MTHSIDWHHKIKGEVLYNEPLSKHTSFRIGGPAEIFILPKDHRDLQTIFKHKGNIPLFALGEGTNLLVRDGGIKGIVVCLREGFKSIEGPVFSTSKDGRETGVFKVGSGVKLSYLAKYAARFGLSGVEGLAGIPGSLGGALIMNAGAEGTEIGAVVRNITRITTTGEVQIIKRDDLEFHYRRTVFPPGDGIIVEAELELQKGDTNQIYETIDRHLSKRSLKQPLTLPNSGSIFKNPPGDIAGSLIESAGLKGFCIGDAGVSIKHANFIVNKGNASARDVLRLIEHVRNVVKEKTGKELETEIVVVGD
ncbi:MAG: UDP-N-acetylenolpyruvoylglucosamine reductase [Nitrospinae bacterium RIFCSPLOWO2_12_FULL_47_7]|nr:MAG: UDP-N-acetylenolpyruvoylglucosamine reductase [Nitrospinae bacterium RIFCSPLOWO2_12_FULL_47_7]